MDRAVSGVAAAIPPSAPGDRLATLREDLELQRGTATNGDWLIYDPLRHRYIQIDQPTFVVLSLWKWHATASALCDHAGQVLGTPVDRAEIDRLTSFLDNHQLTDGGAGSAWRRQAALAHNRHHSPIMWLMHNYLFVKIPLVSPEPFLRLTSGLVAPFFRPLLQRLVLALGLVGLYLASREWDRFAAEARDLASISGLTEIAVVLFAVKGLHELGHAYTALRYGCRVPSMGLAFMMMAPLLYTDVTDAWRLSDRRERLAIDLAGIAVELGLACLATVAWVFLADGMARHTAFLIATTSWVMSLAINLNPFMRFDGYYILADLLRVPNLQTRAFALGRWWMREVLFGLQAACPEPMPSRLRAVLIAYAYSIWAYRLVLFTGIAVLVYGHFFKVLGVVLFLFEIVYFIGRPLAGEALVWWQLRRRIVSHWRFLIPLGALGVVCALAIVPWSSDVRIPAILEGDAIARVFPPRAGRIVAIPAVAAQTVAASDLLLRLEQPDLAHERAIALAQLSAVEMRLDRQSADLEDLSQRQVLEGERASVRAKLDGLARQTAELDVRAPRSGTLVEVNPALHVGQWIGPKEQIALLDGSRGGRVLGYAAEDDLWRLKPQQTGRFVPDNMLAEAFDVTVTELAITGAAQIDLAELASSNGGKIEAHADVHQKLIPSTAQFLVAMAVHGSGPIPVARIRGIVVVHGVAESFFSSAWRRVLRILVRESGL